MTQPVQGIHHITAMASDPQKNVDFYTQVLGQRFVKKTINFDDPGTYHLYYADYVGSPGTVLTFFPWPHAKRGQRGVGEVAETAYNIRPSSLDYWRARLTEFGVSFSEQKRFGQTALVFGDPDDMRVALIVDEEAQVPSHWENGPVPEEHALQGFHGVTMWVREAAPSIAVLSGVFGYEEVGREGDRIRLVGAGNFGQHVDLLVRTDIGRGKMGAGSVHHVAFRTVDDDEQIEWQQILRGHGFGVTDVKDRQYFHSVYLREPNGVLFEIATDAPGFAIDEPVQKLGHELKLPPWQEVNRARIEALLPPVRIPEYDGEATVK